ncbi:hypothetical protein [Leptothoe sp. PORK10 BA2]|uniref:hypothetical protein n=1 Tax=Leptothoe sp. PORK10 BA2 TaxID=3110254 RepID=UPI002B20F233|nr:hypothetical protein [Leptothoe sp. PORK10 BA2]MEA5463856.1 hypothetical protein [Leptothoe sp. PORK10 BA2]
MPSSSRPYKSKLLRFVLQQWQQGLNRQDRAWRQLQSTATWGAQIAIFPFYVIMRAVERASFTLGDSSNGPQESTFAPSTNTREKVTDLDHSLTAILTHTQQLLSADPRSSKPVAQITIAPKSDLMGQVKSFWSNSIQRVRRSGDLTQIRKNQPKQPSRELTHTRQQQLETGQSQTGAITARSHRIRRKIATDLLQNGTTLASVIENRKLVIVNSKNEVFDILTPGQQQDLKHYISRVMQAYQQSRTIVPRQPKKLSVKTVLPICPSSDESFTTILTHTEQLLSSSQTARLTIAPKRSLLHQAKSLLTRAIPRLSRSEALTRPGNNHQPDQTSGLTERSMGMNRRGTSATSDLLQNGITLASTIDDRQLVLVNPRNEIFNILTPEQQTELTHYISRVMRAYRQSRTIVPRQTHRLSVKTVLAIGAVFIAALPVEFKKAWSQIAPGPTGPSLPPISVNGLQAEPHSRVFYPQASAPGTAKARSRRLLDDTGYIGKTDKVNGRRLTSNSPHAFEAHVNDVKYLEHPLERILRLIDRVLTWCENRWQQWLRQS